MTHSVFFLFVIYKNENDHPDMDQDTSWLEAEMLPMECNKADQNTCLPAQITNGVFAPQDGRIYA